MLTALARRLSLPVSRVRRLALFLGLGVAVMSAHALARTAAEAIFLANVGPEALPLYFILVGVGTVPIAVGASRLIDRMPRTTLFAASLVALAVSVLVLRLLVATATPAAYYAALIGIVVVELLMSIQFWVLVSDYFTSLEQKRIVPFLTLGVAAGGILGGSLANVMARVVAAPDVLLAFPVLYALGFLVFDRLRRTQTALQVEDDGARIDGRGAVAEIWELVKGYPIVALLAAVGFLEVMLTGLGSYLSYTIFTESFPSEQELTAFLGSLRAALSALQVLVIFFVTRPLVHRMGVGRMNMIFPSTTFASLGVLAFVPGLPAAILVHANFNTVATGLAAPVENLTYNAVPPRFLGRVRTVSEAMLQPTGLAACGLALAAVQDVLSFRQIVLLTLGVAAVMLVLGAMRSRAYLRALQAQLRDRTLDLSRDDEYLSHLHGSYAEEVRTLLASDDPHVISVGIELATRIDPERYLSDLTPRLESLDDRALGGAIGLMQRVRTPSARHDVARLLRSDDPRVRAAALEALLAQRTVPKHVRPAPLLQDEDERVRGLATTFAFREGPTVDATPVLAELDGLGLEYAVKGVAALPGDSLMPVLMDALDRGTPAARESALRTLHRVSESQVDRVHEQVLHLTRDEEEGVRAAALELLAYRHDELERVARGLTDAKATVRNRVAVAIGDVGDAALPVLETALASARPEVIQAAVRALGRIRTARAADLAFGALHRDYVRAALASEWLQRIPRDRPDWAPLRITLQDANRRAVDTVLEVLGAFGHQTTLRNARIALASRDDRLRANAVEALASLPDRRFVLPVMDLLEALASAAEVEGAVGQPGARDAAPVEELLDVDDRWIRAGAAETLRNLGRPVPPLDDQEEIPMSRLLFLKGVTLFQQLSLDSLMALDQALRRADFLPGEVIFEEGSTGDDFYIVLQGDVVVEKGRGEAARELARMGPGEFFGEMALFDDEPRSATCRAATPTTLLSLDRSRFHGLMEQLPRLGIEISRVLSLRLRRTSGSLHRSRAGAET